MSPGARSRRIRSLGGGAGSYARYYVAHRTNTQQVQDAHSLYLETLAELGPPGLVLLLAALALPLVAAVRMRRHPFVPVAVAAYAVYLVHALADWDWELAGVTLAAVLCGLACLLAAREEREPRALSVRARAGLGAAVTVLGVAALLGLIGNLALGASDSAASNGNWKSAESHARTAIRWQPWSAAGWQQLGEAQIGAGDRAGGAAQPAEGDRQGSERLGHLARPRRRRERRRADQRARPGLPAQPAQPRDRRGLQRRRPPVRFSAPRRY